MSRSLPIALVIAALAGIGSLPSPAADYETAFTEEQMLRAAGQDTSGSALLDFFRRRTQVTADQERIKALVHQLGDPLPAKADQAAGELIALGPLAVRQVRQAARETDDVQRSNRARRCLEFLESTRSASLSSAAARMVALRQPPGSAEVLLAYLPFADDDNVIDEIRNALAAVALRSDKAEPALLKALEDPLPLRRAIAAEALCQVNTEEARPALIKLMNDPEPVVRLKASIALAQTRSPKAISTLITLLADLPLAQARQAEEYLQSIAGEQAPRTGLGSDPVTQEKCRDAWAAWWLGTESPTYLDDIKKRTLNDGTREKALTLMQQLGDDSFEVRQKATNELLLMGPVVLPFLKQGAASTDAEVSSRVRKCMDAIEKDKFFPLSPMVVRLASLRRPPGTVETLLAYLPSAEDATLATEVQAALNSLALQDGKPDPALLNALQDKSGIRRAAAATALAPTGLSEVRPLLRKLLQDTDPLVRLRVAIALVVTARDKEGVPALIELLGDPTSGLGEQAELQLLQLAGDRGPKISLSRDLAGRQKCKDAWAGWWRDHGEGIELTRATTAAPRYLGFTIYTLIENGQVIEMDRTGKVRWQLDGIQYPSDVQLLPGDRVLVAEYNGNRVTERNLKNEILWEKRLNNSAVTCQRLPNGNTFVASRSELMEVDPTGKEIFNFNRPNGDIMAAQKLRDGQIVCSTSSGTCVRLDSTGKEVKTFAIGAVALGCLEVLPGNRLLIPQYSSNKVVEYDLDGKVLWEANVSQPLGAFRLANGNTLISSYGNNMLLELDRAGKTVWEMKTNGRPGRIRRR